MISDLLTLGVAGAAAHFLLYRALITRWLWSRYPRQLEVFFACSACTGFWVGLGIGLYWRWSGTDALGLHADLPALPIAAGLAAMVTSPAVAWVQIAALERLGQPPSDLVDLAGAVPEGIAHDETALVARPTTKLAKLDADKLLEKIHEDAEKTEG